MIHEIDAALAALLRDEVLGDAKVSIAFDPPNRPWIQTVSGPTLDVFLYDVRENVVRREVMLEPVYDEEGKLVAKRSPARRYDLFYTLSVWGTPVALEHHILAAVTVGLARFETLPAGYVPAAIRDRGNVFVGVAAGAKRMMPGNLGGDMKIQLELVLTLPLPTTIDLPSAAPVVSPLAVDVRGPQQSEQVQGRPPVSGLPQQRPTGPPTGASAPGVDPAVARAELARAAAGAPAAVARPAGPPGARPAGPPGAPQRPADPMAQLRAALGQAAQAQAAIAQAQAALLAAMGARRPAPAPAAGPPPPQPPA